MMFDYQGYLEVQKKLTEVYVQYDPTELVLIPTVETRSSTGGYTAVDDTPKPPQTFKRIAQAGVGNSRPRVTIAGVERIVDYVLLGAWDSDVEVGDHWTDAQGTTYWVIAIDAGHGYEKKVFVERKRPKHV